jgi:hypothetical protein
MTTYDIPSTRDRAPFGRVDVIGHVANVIAAAAHHIKEHRTITALSRLGPRRLRDMGFDPEAIYAAVDGSWNEVPARARFPKV